MNQRLPLILSATALSVAVFGSTPLGGAAGDLLAKVVPLASYATNAGAVDSIKALQTPKPGYLVPLGPDGKFPASVGQVGPQGAPGAAGPAGPSGPAGPKGDPGAAAAVTPHCPAGLQQGADLCFDPTARAAATWTAALNTCALANLRLPTPGEMGVVLNNTDSGQDSEWTDAVAWDNGPGWSAVGLGNTSSRSLYIVTRQIQYTMAYRCVTSVQG